MTQLVISDTSTTIPVYRRAALGSMHRILVPVVLAYVQYYFSFI